jgi:hypothetical protein
MIKCDAKDCKHHVRYDECRLDHPIEKVVITVDGVCNSYESNMEDEVEED